MNLKDSVLQILQNPTSKDGWVSGQEMALRSGVTRTSIWKAVTFLRKQGVGIEAQTKKGYKLTFEDIFSEQNIQKYLDKTLGIKVEFYKSIDSTNTECKRKLTQKTSKELHKLAIVAEEQTQGRGRLGRSFTSPSKTGIYLSFIYSDKNITKPAMFTATAAVAVVRAINKVYGIESGIKWVNDIYIEGKKVCGILTEGVTNFETGLIESVIVGIGINICDNELLPQDVAGGIYSSIPQTDSSNSNTNKRSELAARVLEESFYILDGGTDKIEEAMREYKDRSILINKEIEVTHIIDQEKNNYKCTVLDITNDGKLIVKLPSGEEKTLESGEVSIHSKKM